MYLLRRQDIASQKPDLRTPCFFSDNLHVPSSPELTRFISLSLVFTRGVRALGLRSRTIHPVLVEKLQAPVCSSDQLDMLSCGDGAMQHCQQAPVSNEFSTAVLADSVVAKGGWGGLFIQYYSHSGIRHGHSLPQHHLVRWTFFPPVRPC